MASAAFGDYAVSAPHIGPANGMQSQPSVASNGRDYLAAWIDERSGTTAAYATRIGANGIPAGEGGVAVTPAQSRSTVVVPHGDDYSVFTSIAGGGLAMTHAAEMHLFATRDNASIAVAWNGSVFLIVQSAVSPEPLLGIVIDDSFNVVTPAFPISTGPGNNAGVASDGRDFVVIWDERGLRGAVVSAGGIVQPNAQLISTIGAGLGASIAWAHDRYVAAWSDGSVHQRELGPDATPISIDMTISSRGESPAVAWNGSAAAVAYVSNGAVMVGLPDVIFRTIAIAPGDQPSIASAAGRFLVAYRQQGDVHSKLVDGPDAVLALSLSGQRSPRGLFDGANFAFVWEEGTHVRFGRSTPSGELLDGDGIDLGEGMRPQIAFAGDEYLIAWFDSSLAAIRAVRISHDGHRLDPPLTLPYGIVALATDGLDFLMLGSDGATLSSTIVTHEGTVVRGTPIAVTVRGFGDLQAVWSGRRYIITFEEAGLFLSATSAAVLDRTGRVTVPRSGTPVGVLAPGRGYALVLGAGNGEIFMQTIDEDGVFSPVTTLGKCGCYSADVAWNGIDYFIAFNQTIIRLGGSTPITIDGASSPVTLAGGRGAVAIVYQRATPVPRLFWVPVPPHTIRRLWRS